MEKQEGFREETAVETGKYAVSASGGAGEPVGRAGEKPNMITVAWTGTVCTNPPMAYISVRPERYSHDDLSGRQANLCHQPDDGETG